MTLRGDGAAMGRFRYGDTGFGLDCEMDVYYKLDGIRENASYEGLPS